MHKNLTPKEIKFCHQYLKTGVASEAYAEAYVLRRGATSHTQWVKNEASIVLKKPRVQEYIAELRAQARDKAIYSAEVAMQEAKKAYEIALEDRQPSAMVSAARLRADIAGVIVQRSLSVSKSIRDIPQHELDAQLSIALKQLNVKLVDVSEQEAT